MKNRHLKNRSGWWHYRRRIPGDVAGEFDRQTIDLALRTKDAGEARKRRDRIDAEYERKWQRSRDRKAKGLASPAGAGEEEDAYIAYINEGAGTSDEDDFTLAGSYFDEFDALAARQAKGPNSADLDDARRQVAETPKGKRLVRLINAAQGRNVGLDLGGLCPAFPGLRT